MELSFSGGSSNKQSPPPAIEPLKGIGKHVLSTAFSLDIHRHHRKEYHDLRGREVRQMQEEEMLQKGTVGNRNCPIFVTAEDCVALEVQKQHSRARDRMAKENEPYKSDGPSSPTPLPNQLIYRHHTPSTSDNPKRANPNSVPSVMLQGGSISCIKHANFSSRTTVAEKRGYLVTRLQIPQRHSYNIIHHQLQPASSSNATNIIAAKPQDKLKVYVRATGKDGKPTIGYLLNYNTAEEITIVCNCHGNTFTPTEFAEHAGCSDSVMAYPLRHIRVFPSQ